MCWSTALQATLGGLGVPERPTQLHRDMHAYLKSEACCLAVLCCQLWSDAELHQGTCSCSAAGDLSDAFDLLEASARS